MKIALTHFNLTTESGDPKMVLSIAKKLHDSGHTVVVYCADFDANTCFPRLNQGLDIRVVKPPAPLSSVRGAHGALGKVWERIRQIKLYNAIVEKMSEELDKDFDFIICENDYSYKIGMPYKRLRPETKVIWIMNNPPFFHSRKDNFLAEILSRGAGFFEKWSALKYGRGIDWIVVYDEISKRLAQETGKPVKIIRNPIDIDYFYAPVKKGILQKKGVQLLSLGALSPQRRFEDTISAAAILRKKGYDARVSIICKDYWDNRQYREKFENFIRTSAMGDYVDTRFRGASEKEYLEVIRASDIFVLPNNIKIWGVGAFETMAAGLPIIVSRATAVAEILHDGKDALFVDALKPDQIVEKVEVLIKNQALYTRIAFAGQKLVKDEMGLDNFIKEILKPPGLLKNSIN